MTNQIEYNNVTSSPITLEEALAKHGRVIFPNVGTSMMPLLRQNRDLSVIERRPVDQNGKPLRCKKYDVVMYRRRNKYILHRILKVLPNGYVICGDHNRYKEYDINDKDIIGIMTAFVRDGVETPVTDRRYRIYVHLWCNFYLIRSALLWLKSYLYRIKSAIKKFINKISKKNK